MKNKITVSLKGYMKDRPKLARVTVGGTAFSIIDANTGYSVYSGELSAPVVDPDSGDKVRTADFSGFTGCGRFYVKVGFRRSITFEISEKPYRSLAEQTIGAIYASRCGCRLRAEDVPEGLELESFMHAPCHTQTIDGRDVSGGWHNMGGYDRDASRTALVAAQILYSLCLFPDNRSEEMRRRLFEEARWGLEFLMKMQDDDGGVFENAAPFRKPLAFAARPEEDMDRQCLGEKTCLAALRFTAVCALGSRVFSEYDKLFAYKLSAVVQRSWIFICSCDEYKCYFGHLGDIAEDGTPYALESDFMWCFSEMYALTGQKEFYDIICKKHMTSQFTGFTESAVGGFAALAALLSRKKYDGHVLAVIRHRLTDHADMLCLASEKSAYGCTCGANGGFSYGTAFRLISNVQSTILAYLLTGNDKYLKCTSEGLSCLFGMNSCAKAFVTGNRRGFVHYPSHMASAAVPGDECLPGLVVCGPNKFRADSYSKWVLKSSDPPALCYTDSVYSISTNEPALHYTAALLFVASFYERIGVSALTGAVKGKRYKVVSMKEKMKQIVSCE